VVATFPPWLVLPPNDPAPLAEMERLLCEHGLHTVCESADCPNVGECFARGTCTFMILGDVCTRHCRFCAVSSGRPSAPSSDEPERIARAAQVLGLQHVVVTSVTRDDLQDGGAQQFAATIAELLKLSGVTVEVLVPDFGGDVEAVGCVLGAGPHVLGHNIETVPRLYRRVRPGASYERSLKVIAQAARSMSYSKSGLMLGLGETLQEVFSVLADLRSAGCEAVTLGQYLRPSSECLPVFDFVAPQTFAALERKAYSMGFKQVKAGPLVRSSYHSEVPVGPSRPYAERSAR
jgi:lipoic acid synthetase